MIISRTPFRVSFFGGGTDYPVWYRENGGAVLGTTIDKFYGYWITRIAHRIPNANPSQDPTALTRVATCFTAQDESSANKIAQEIGTAYVIVDYEAASVRGPYITINIGGNDTAFIYAGGTLETKFWAVVTWAGGDPAEFLDIYLVPLENQMVPVVVFHPEYYQSLSTRLYSFDGKAITPESTPVISYQEVADQKGNLYKVITSLEQFNSYEEAEAYIASQESGNYEIVGTDPTVSPVPLEALSGYKLVFGSDNISLGSASVPAVKIFEFTDRVPLYTP